MFINETPEPLNQGLETTKTLFCVFKLDGPAGAVLNTPGVGDNIFKTNHLKMKAAAHNFFG